VWNTGTVIAKHLVNHVSDPKLFGEYYEIYKRLGHDHISMNKLFEKCNDLVHDTIFIAQIIPHVVQQQFACKSRFVHRNQYIIDVQGFKYFNGSKHSLSNEFVMREFCIVSTDGTVLFHCLVKLPCHMNDLPAGLQRQNQWLTEKFHGLKWDSTNGYTITHIRKIIFMLCKGDAMFFCKGLEKVDWIKKLFQLKNVKDISEHGCPSLSELNFPVGCSYHTPIEPRACALRNCLQLQYWKKHQMPRLEDDDDMSNLVC
jgi:hypothetical protein